MLGAADPAARVWTWAPAQQDAGFVIRHQVQEAVGHHWDAAHAAGRAVRISPAVGADAVDEFLHFSVSNADDAEGDDPLPARSKAGSGSPAPTATRPGWWPTARSREPRR